MLGYHQLAFLVFNAFQEHFYIHADYNLIGFGKFGHGYGTFRFKPDIHDHITAFDGDHTPLHDFAFGDVLHGFIVKCDHFLELFKGIFTGFRLVPFRKLSGFPFRLGFLGYHYLFFYFFHNFFLWVRWLLNFCRLSGFDG